MRSVCQGLLCAGLIVGSSGAVAAHEVKIWVPTPVKVAPPEAPAVNTAVKVINLVAVGHQGRCRAANDFGLDYRYGGCSSISLRSRYPF